MWSPVSKKGFGAVMAAVWRLVVMQPDGDDPLAVVAVWPGSARLRAPLLEHAEFTPASAGPWPMARNCVVYVAQHAITGLRNGRTCVYATPPATAPGRWWDVAGRRGQVLVTLGAEPAAGLVTATTSNTEPITDLAELGTDLRVGLARLAPDRGPLITPRPIVYNSMSPS
ncbi:hypothetical protein EV191_108127 [Tamaricihabitans halophyticus]|uniref:Uncharacterized protein n=2 Tax=Tamaricihabitans halophyticus TaxID=1262583 RepID=A0A4R2QKR4_9PSEU|nr:hypothetical protein EV191_108127 [Tamaricihabitans halophyticus]